MDASSSSSSPTEWMFSNDSSSASYSHSSTTPSSPDFRFQQQYLPTPTPPSRMSNGPWGMSMMNNHFSDPHNALLASGNPTYAKIQTMYSELCIKYQTLESAYTTLATSVPQVFRVISNPFNIPILESSSTLSSTSAGAPIPLNSTSPGVLKLSKSPPSSPSSFSYCQKSKTVPSSALKPTSRSTKPLSVLADKQKGKERAADPISSASKPPTPPDSQPAAPVNSAESIDAPAGTATVSHPLPSASRSSTPEIDFNNNDDIEPLPIELTPEAPNAPATNRAAPNPIRQITFYKAIFIDHSQEIKISSPYTAYLKNQKYNPTCPKETPASETETDNTHQSAAGPSAPTTSPSTSTVNVPPEDDDDESEPAAKQRHRPGKANTAWNIFGRVHMKDHPRHTTAQARSVFDGLDPVSKKHHADEAERLEKEKPKKSKDEKVAKKAKKAGGAVKASVEAATQDVIQGYLNTVRAQCTSCVTWPVGLLSCDTQAADLELLEGNVAAARVAFKKSFALSIEADDNDLQLFFLERLGDHTHGMHALEETWRWAGVYLVAALTDDSKWVTKRALRCIGTCLDTQGDDETALNVFQVSLDGFTLMDGHEGKGTST
ncbi:hypothetical protein B0H13DRAFT_1853567 [Mycena leptocephala]|nr:hypothetical protein B0H13DRAFT_1853567 [Mycena leptocephala]